MQSCLLLYPEEVKMAAIKRQLRRWLRDRYGFSYQRPSAPPDVVDTHGRPAVCMDWRVYDSAREA